MSFSITVWQNFAKKKNSTAQPTPGAGSVISCDLKEGCSVEKPVFLLTNVTEAYNYVYAWGHYYFVDDCKWIRTNLCELSCSMDVLATFKTEIGNYTALVERSAYSYETMYPDPAVSVQNATKTAEVEVSTSSFFSNAGCFVVSVINNIGSGTGFTTSYVMDGTGLQSLAQYLNTDFDSLQAQDVLQWLQATFLKTANSVIDCIYMPLVKTEVAHNSAGFEQVVIGVDQVPACWADRMSSPYIATAVFNVTIPHFYSDFRKAPPYTTGKIYLPGFGVTDFNPADFPSGSMKVAFAVDVMTGDTIAYLTVPGSNLDDRVVASYSYNIAVSCPVARVGSNVTGTATGVLSTAGNLMAYKVGGAYAGVSGAAAISSGINTLATALGTTASVSGSKSGRAGIAETDIHVTVIARDTQDPASLTVTSGRPCMAAHQISTIPGYIKCIDADVSIAGFSEEKDEVNNYLNNGFYYE